MSEYFAAAWDVFVIGAGHAGLEAALAAARLGCATGLVTMNLDAVGNMPCNPSIGGTAKGHLVREIDALGGEMGRAADRVFLQSRMLNRGKGPAVHSLRVQADRRKYQNLMKHTVETTEHLTLCQAEIVSLRRAGDEWECVTRLGAVHRAKTVILASGTYLRGRIIVGDVNYPGGPDGMFPAASLSDSLRELGIELMRFKTGTPPRVLRSSVDLSRLEPQPGDDPVTPFSFENEGRDLGPNRRECYLVYTNEETHRVIRENLHRSPLYSGVIEGVGPRYCPSIEDKVVRFADKPRHQLFLEPMGEDTEEMYLQGFSSSLPEDVQLKMLRTLPGFERVRMMRTAYAIEYDCADPLQLLATLEFRAHPGLYGAGQFNGTSGYEEAACQGLIAGINAARKCQNKPPVTLDRSTSYIGTLIDDLVTRGTDEPYRIMTSRSEYRLLLRQDNADARLTPLGYEIGLISLERYEKFREKYRLVEEELRRAERTFFSPEETAAVLRSRASAPAASGLSLADLLRRPELDYDCLAPLDRTRPPLPAAVREQVEISLKYAGYIQRQLRQVEQFRKTERRALPPEIDYDSIAGLRLEARQKLSRLRPASLGQASRISGVSPADVAVLLIWLEQHGRTQ